MIPQEDIFTDATGEVLVAAMSLAKENGHAEVYPAHMVSVMIDDGGASVSGHSTGGRDQTFLQSVITKAGGDPTPLKRAIQKLIVRLPVQQPIPETVSLGRSASSTIENARRIQKDSADSYVAQDHLLLALIQDQQIAAAFKEGNMNETAIKAAIKQIRGNRRVESKTAEKGFDALAKYAVDLTKLAEEGKLDPVIGRDNEIRRMIRILCRRTKNNPVLIGEPGVGKSALAEGLAQRIVKRDVPASLFGRLFSLDMGALMAGAKYKGEYEERVKSVLKRSLSLPEIEKNADEGIGIILFIDELHLIMAGGGGEGMDAANLLKPMLARGKLSCIGATTLAEYRKYIEKDAAFERRFAQVIVSEPSVADTISILRGISEKYEVHHGVRILDSALFQAATLAHRYLTSRRLPDSAIDLVDEACASVRVARETAPEAIDALERRKLQLEVEIHALSREKDLASKERLQAAKKAVADVEEQLRPLRAAHDAENERGNEIAKVRRRIDELKAKADDAERRYDLAVASDLRYYAIPDLQKRLQSLEATVQAQHDASGVVGTDTVTPEAIAEIVGRWTGIPVTRLLSTERDKLIQMEKTLSSSIIGQPEAVKAVANAIRLSRSGLSSENRPIASFLFAGPSGTGKTLMSKTLATILFDSPDAMIRIDGSEYSEKHSISRLIGAPPGYVGHDSGGQLTEYVRRKPYAIVLIDEIEKACREFVTIFLQVLDDGRLTDGQGRVVDFRNTVIIMTSNLGAAYLNALGPGPIPAHVRELVMGAIETHLPPEFRNRIDEIIIYRPLSRSNVRKIVDLRLKEFEQRLAPKKLRLDLDDAAKDYLGSIGYSPSYGARPLNRAMQEQILNPLAMHLLQEKVREGEMVRVRFDGPSNHLKLIPNHRGVATPVEAEEDMDLDYLEIDGPQIEEPQNADGGAIRIN
ncbi:hypothetical protein BS47DRAFT_1362009 [Hydnum rufescens UP504]|uniref:Clp R domain-containing protein n=1 Tax=Hydnum rufescens UP504 TaxID=1448309 RepID=A0A9P6DWW5_9AGAM|nr:hypothetical protein BS47DRAFT_1362009 [Hydnum rufescens UP504]